MPALCADPRCRGREPTHRCCWPAPGMPRCGRWSATPVPGPRRWPATSRPPIPLPAGADPDHRGQHGWRSAGGRRTHRRRGVGTRRVPGRVSVAGCAARGQLADLAAAARLGREDGRRPAHHRADRVRLGRGAPAPVRHPRRRVRHQLRRGPGFRDARQVRLGGLGLRVGERFFYEYNFFAGWRVDLRVEEIVAAEPGRVYPRCTAGRRAGPPEGWDGPWAFLDATQPHLVFAATLRAAEIVGQLLDADPDAEPATVGVDRDELTALLPPLGLERFDRRGLNRALADLATTTETKPS